MRGKMRLDLDQLQVDSFVPEAGAGEVGTVQAHASQYTMGTDPTCEGRPSCNYHNTCNYDSCDTVCGTYYCIPGDSGLNDSCQWTCDCPSIAYPC